MFGHAYRFATRAGVESHAPLPLPGAARDELLVAALMLPFAYTDIRAPVHTTLYASDARGGHDPRLGVVSTSVSPTVAGELWRHRNRRAGHVSLRDPGGSSTIELVRHVLGDDDDELAEDCDADASEDPVSVESSVHVQRRWVDPLAEGCGWYCVTRFRKTPTNERIHLGELRGVREVARHAVRVKKLRDVRLLTLCDSTVCVGAVAKGRSSSSEVNWLLRTFVFELLFAGVQLGLLHVGTDSNPADAPSRNLPTRTAPAVDAPSWVERFLEGDLCALDPHLPHGAWERLVLPLAASPSPVPPDHWSLSSYDYDAVRPDSNALDRAAGGLHARLRGVVLPQATRRSFVRDLECGGVHLHSGPALARA